MNEHRKLDELEAELDRVRAAPQDAGALELIVRRPGPAERELLEVGVLDTELGLLGDRWAADERMRRTPDETERGDQLTIISARAAAMFAGGDDHDRWALAGDQLYVDLDLSHENLPIGARLAIGETVVEVTPDPHQGCGKFIRRFGFAALKLANSSEGRSLRLRGLHALVVEPGEVRRGDRIEKLPAAMALPKSQSG